MNTRPVTGWILFGRHERPIVRQQFPNLPMGEVASEVLQRWRNLSDVDHQAWMNNARLINMRNYYVQN